MKTDHALAELFSRNPDLIKLMAHVPDNVHYTMKSEVFKEVERRIDACFIPNQWGQPVIITEFQGYGERGFYYRSFSNAGLFGERNPHMPIFILLVFLNESNDPKTEPWYSLGRSGFPGFQVVYLVEVIGRLRERDPNHPIAALFELLVESNIKTLKKRARKGYQNIQSADLPVRLRETYVKLFTYWLMQRLANHTREEVDKMLGILTPLRETRAYQDIAREVRGEILVERIIQEIKLLDRLKDSGSLPKAAYNKEVVPLRKELEEIRAKRNS